MTFDWKKEYHRYSHYLVSLDSLYKKKEVIVYTGLTLSFFAVAFFTLFALKPTVNIILSLVSEIKEKNEISLKLQTKINNIAQAQNNYSSQSQQLLLVDEALPASLSLKEIVDYLELLFQQNEITVKNIDYEPITVIEKASKTKTKTDELQEVPFSFKVSGAYSNLKIILAQLENIRRIIVIDSFKINQSGIDTPDILNLSVTGKAFFLPMEK